MDEIKKIIQDFLKNPPDWWNEQIDIWNSADIDVLFEKEDGL